MYPLWDVRNDQCVLEIPWDAVAVNRDSQRQGVVRQDLWDLLRVSQIVEVLASFFSSAARMSSSRWGCLQSASRRCMYSHRHDSLIH
jgi:hypothetical protein